MPFKDAFNCQRCPQSNDPRAKRACPAWWETRWRDELGKEHPQVGCAFAQLPHYFNMLWSQCATASASSQEARNQSAMLRDSVVAEVQRGFRALALATDAGLTDVKDTIVSVARLAENLPTPTERSGHDPATVHSDCGSDQQPGLWPDLGTSHRPTHNGADVLRHHSKQADMVEHYDCQLERRNGSERLGGVDA